MREILFKGKRVDNGEWVEGGLIPKGKDHPTTIWGINSDFGDYVDPETVGQFTCENDITGINTPLSVDAEMSFECDINMKAYGKIMGIDLSNAQDISAATVIFKSPYQVQKRRHKKKRINKKWAKRYGYVTKFKSYQLEDVHFEQRGSELEVIGSDVRVIY